ncbi:MAG: hypothetical protein IKJ29_05605 [Akkermansia sp.]|nr:hypothetical protein [Akkermansia sp.]
MKPRLSHILLSALLVCGTYQAQATRVGTVTVFGSTSRLEFTLTDTSLGKANGIVESNVASGEQELSTAGIQTDKYAPLVKTGEGTATVTTNLDMGSALFVREGSVKVSNSTLTLNPADVTGLQVATIGSDTPLSISGKNASMSIDGGKVVGKAAGAAMVVGGLDGDGSLTVSNKSIVDNYSNGGSYFLIGVAKDKASNEYNSHVHSTGYNEGTKAAESGIGKGVVTVDDSSIFCGYASLAVGEGELILKNNAGVYAGYDHTVGTIDKFFDADGNIAATPIGHVTTQGNYETSFGAVAGATSKISIESGSKLSVGNSVKFGAFADSKVTLDIKGGTFEQAGANSRTYMGYSFDRIDDGKEVDVKLVKVKAEAWDHSFNNPEAVDSAIDITVSGTESGKGELKLQDVYMGNAEGKGSVNVTINDNASFSAKMLEVQSSASIINYGTLTASELVLLGGSLENSGSLEADVEMSGGVFTMCNGATAKGLTATAGTVNIAGNVTFTGVVNFGTVTSPLAMLGSSESTSPLTINIKQGSTIKMEDVALNIGAGVVFNVDLVGDSKLDEGETLFTIDYGNLDSAYVEEQLNQISTSVSYNGTVVETFEPGSLEVKADGSTSVVPEPATATLSLLALAALASRRRRK